MVSGGQVRSDASSLSTFNSNYISIIDGLASSWKGSSFDSINSQSQQVSSEFVNTIKGQMEAYATACDLYADYVNSKTNLGIAQSNYNTAVSSVYNTLHSVGYSDIATAGYIAQIGRAHV